MAKEFKSALTETPANDDETRLQDLAKNNLPKIAQLPDRFNEEKRYPRAWNFDGASFGQSGSTGSEMEIDILSHW